MTQKGPCTQQLGTWLLGNSNYSSGLGKYMIIWYLDPKGDSIRGYWERVSKHSKQIGYEASAIRS